MKQACIICLSKRLELVRALIYDHILLLLVKKEPDADDTAQVLLAHLVEVRLGAVELLLALLFQHLEVEAEEALHARRVLNLQILHVREQCVQVLD